MASVPAKDKEEDDEEREHEQHHQRADPPKLRTVPGAGPMPVGRLRGRQLRRLLRDRLEGRDEQEEAH